MAGLRLLNAPQPLPLLSASLVSRRLSAASGMSNLEYFCFSRTPLFSSYYFRKHGPQHRNIVAIRSITVKAETIKADFVEADSSHKTLTGDEIRRRFLNFYASKGHEIMPSSSLVPDDPTVLLTIAGMLQFKPVFLGKVMVPLLEKLPSKLAQR